MMKIIEVHIKNLDTNYQVTVLFDDNELEYKASQGFSTKIPTEVDIKNIIAFGEKLERTELEKIFRINNV
jgi:hypothetical protein